MKIKRVIHKKTNVIDINPYYAKLIVIIDNDPSKAVTRLNIEHRGIDIDFHGSDLSSACITYERIFKPKGDKFTSLFLVVVFDQAQITPGLIAHEACHVVNAVFKSKGVELDLEQDEPQAYLLGWVVDEIHKVWKLKYRKQ